MIEQQGQVVAVSGGKASVRIGGKSGCAACDAGKGCGAGVFGRMLQRKPQVLEFQNDVNAVCGEAVVVGLPEALFLRLIARLYLFPVLAGLAGAVSGHFAGSVFQAGRPGVDAFALLGALAAAVAVIAWNRKKFIEFPVNGAVHLLRVVNKTEFAKDEEVYL
jgi:sigma-E factor negative regulatory protein RseC